MTAKTCNCSKNDDQTCNCSKNDSRYIRNRDVDHRDTELVTATAFPSVSATNRNITGQLKISEAAKTKMAAAPLYHVLRYVS